MKKLSLSLLLLAIAFAGCKTENPTQPSVFNVRDFGAKGNGTTKDTRAFQKAFKHCAAHGGTVLVPPGNYLIGSVRMGAHTTLQLQEGSVIIGDDNTNDYPMVPVRWEGRWETGRCGLIYATNADDVAIVGPGRIEGNPKMAAPQNPRGSVVLEFTECHGVRWEGFSVTQGGNWATHPVYCSDVVIKGLNITGRRDGIDVDSCTNVWIENCDIETSDDSISLKSGRGAKAAAIGRPTEDVVITNCTLIDHRFACVGIGSETSGGIRNVRISHCRLTAFSGGIYIKTRIGRGSYIENISGDDLDVLGGGFLFINLDSAGNLNTADDAIPGAAGYPRGRNFSFSNVRLKDAKVLVDAKKIAPQLPLEGLTLSNITGNCTSGISLANIVRVKLSDIHVTGYKGALLTRKNVSGTGFDQLQ
jgi:polygalacturonase